MGGKPRKPASPWAAFDFESIDWRVFERALVIAEGLQRDDHPGRERSKAISLILLAYAEKLKGVPHGG